MPQNTRTQSTWLSNSNKNTFFLSIWQLGVVLLEQGKSSQALAYLDKALEIDPDHGQALLNSAILLQEIGRPELRSIARERLRKLLTMDGKFSCGHNWYPLHFTFYYLLCMRFNANVSSHSEKKSFGRAKHTPFHTKCFLIYSQTIIFKFNFSHGFFPSLLYLFFFLLFHACFLRALFIRSWNLRLVSQCHFLRTKLCLYCAARTWMDDKTKWK